MVTKTTPDSGPDEKLAFAQGWSHGQRKRDGHHVSVDAPQWRAHGSWTGGAAGGLWQGHWWAHLGNQVLKAEETGSKRELSKGPERWGGSQPTAQKYTPSGALPTSSSFGARAGGSQVPSGPGSVRTFGSSEPHCISRGCSGRPPGRHLE